jgi:non-specific serine/threonine protein kinase/serine/threonine-protein kinase
VPEEESFEPAASPTEGETGQGKTWTKGTQESRGVIVGRYHLVQMIGEGGMGEVWLAEQKEPVRRRVALKLIKAGMNTREVIARFESERQALALMDHPAIAKVLDAGATPQGAPYFVMEYVAGVPITTYCDNHRLNTRERLELFVKVCEGVQHAHQKAIIHRDLKPSNILVTELDGHATPKIIDFGIAKALNQRLTAKTLFTQIGVMVGTPEYVSPEQALSSGEDVDTRTDVYSLGIVLYELLVGVPPLELRKIAFDEFLRRLRQDDPPKPSTKVRTQDATTASELARKRQTESSTLARLMQGEIDDITLKAIEKDRSRRYDSPSEFAADIGRYLRDEPVLAVPPSAAYRMRKFARRHRGALVTTCAFLLVLVAATIVSVRQSIRANREAAVEEAVSEFLQNDLLAQASADKQSASHNKPDPDLKVRTVLDRAAAQIPGKFERQPEVESAIRDTIGQTYMDLGVYGESKIQLDRALSLERTQFGVDSPKTLRTLSRLGRLADLQGNDAEAERLLVQALDAQRRLLGPEHPNTLVSMTSLGIVYWRQGKAAQAEATDKQLVATERRVLGLEHLDTLRAMNNLTLVYWREGKLKDGEVLGQEVVDTDRRVFGPEHPDTLRAMNNLAAIYGNEEKWAEAEALDRQILEIRRRVLGPEQPATLSSMNNLSTAYDGEGKYADAEAIADQALQIQRRVLGPEHPDTVRTLMNVASYSRALGNYALAESLGKQALQSERRVLGADNPETLFSAQKLAYTYFAEHKYAQAEALDSQTLDIERHVFGPENPSVLLIQDNLGAIFQEQGKYAQAEALYRNYLAGDPNSPVRMNALAWYLVSARDRRQWRPVEALDLARRALHASGDSGWAFNTLGLAEYRAGRWTEAIDSLNRAVQIDGNADPTNFFFLAMAHWRRGDKDEAQSFLEQGTQVARTRLANNPEWRMPWAEAAELLGKAGPPQKPA